MREDDYPRAIRRLYRTTGPANRKAWERKLRSVHSCGKLTCPLAPDLLRERLRVGEERQEVGAADPDPMVPVVGPKPALKNPAPDRRPRDARDAADVADGQELPGLRKFVAPGHQLALYPGLRLDASRR